VPAKVSTRYEVPPAVVRLLAPVFRYSARRNAYVLRIVGRRGYGPVLKVRRPEP